MNIQAWLLYHHARHLSTFHDLHAVMAFTAMANGVDDSAEAYLWQARAEALVESMKDYVRSGGLRPTPEGLGGETPDAAQQPTPPGIVQLHSFSAGRNRGAVDAVGRRDTEELTVGNGGPGGAGAGPPDNLWVAEQVGVSLCEGMVAYRKVCESRLWNGTIVRGKCWGQAPLSSAAEAACCQMSHCSWYLGVPSPCTRIWTLRQ